MTTPTTAELVIWLRKMAISLRASDEPTHDNDKGFDFAADRLSEMDAEIKMLRQSLWEDDTVATMYAALCGARHALDLLMGDTDPDYETPAILAMQAIQRAIESAHDKGEPQP